MIKERQDSGVIFYNMIRVNFSNKVLWQERFELNELDPGSYGMAEWFKLGEASPNTHTEEQGEPTNHI